MPDREGYVNVRGCRTWFRVVGDLADDAGALPPLVVIHGGPGLPHNYLDDLRVVARTGRPVVFYDQLGCGRSDRPHDPRHYTVSLFVEELSELRRHLGIDRCHIFGQSWGGMLALEYLLTSPTGVSSVVLASAPASMPLFAEETGRLRRELPPAVQMALEEHEAAGSTSSTEYRDAAMFFNRRHVCRLDPLPAVLTSAMAAFGTEVYETMVGASECHVTGTLRDWSVEERLSEIALPTLVMSGRFDEVTPLLAERLAAGLPDCRRVMFEQSSHMPHLEEPQRFVDELLNFLAATEQRADP